MPLFPSPSLKFRTAGFPQYGFKADLSGDAFRSVALFKPTPGIRNATDCLPSPFVSSETESWTPVLSRAGSPLRDTVIRASRPYPRGPRSGQGYVVPVHQHLLTSSEPLMNTPRFPGRSGYTKSQCCAGAPRLPTSGSELSLPILVSMLPSSTPENSSVAYTQFLHWRHSLHLHATGSAFSRTRHSPLPTGRKFSRLTVHICYGLLTCLPP